MITTFGPFRRSRTVASLVLAGVMSLTLAACASEEANKNAVSDVGGTFEFHTPGGQTEIFYDESERRPIANLRGPSLMNEDETLSLDDFAGEVVVLNSWGQWCAPCRAEVDDLQRAHEELSESGGTVLGINVRDYNQTISQDFVKDNGVEYPSIYDPPFRSAAALGGIPTSVVPTTIILDKQHRPAAVFLREVTDQDILDAALPLLDES
ncbi:TlpA family protein disulfide reductase [Corynebacterium pseudodiphtheriticum]|uniref:TlpA family protein disulfide reductase n=1 Tax=Corynebacterium pseudodiphtheriticum TaxID=37637 RepID=UPI000F893E48|nr:TlpA disulfide reductase family protein [Corynebacterium pseudodiphtheriticum]RUP90973.1 TlpA family protein disulfide reductase [Corynebacterium pseudodiphtheriticum]RUP97506.1 TlpA family protein disulfide reductase [Corynebacterium pseudodiphtheriticum]RUQ00491.1 TlpA family protein disulfide reductase [Corynebacterium pseudodiphtheriticum]RUQ48093.1 TlpA family protein disulfide reductase [Corynebacterium pseudodiphtheriticum]